MKRLIQNRSSHDDNVIGYRAFTLDPARVGRASFNIKGSSTRRSQLHFKVVAPIYESIMHLSPSRKFVKSEKFLTDQINFSQTDTATLRRNCHRTRHNPSNTWKYKVSLISSMKLFANLHEGQKIHGQPTDQCYDSKTQLCERIVDDP